MSARRILLLLPLLGIACGDGGRRAGTEPTASTAQAAAESILETEPRAAWAWVERASIASGRRPTHVTGHSARLIHDSITPLAATMAFVSHFREAFRMNEPAAHFVARREEHDELGMTHLRLQQIERGVPVLGGELLSHFDRDGSLRTIDSTAIPELAAIDVRPELGPEEAAIRAREHFASLHDMASTVDGTPELVIAAPITGPDAGQPKLAYHLELRSPDDARVWVDYAIDAHTGGIVETYDKAASLVGSGRGTYGEVRAIEVTKDGSGYRLVDASRTANHISTFDLQNKGLKVPGLGSMLPGSARLPGAMVTSSSATAGWDPAAVDAHFFAGITYDFYKTSFNRKGIDDKDSAIVSSVHVMKGWANAQWDGAQMLYGDGDGERVGQTSAALDVVAHELTHGVTFATSKLRYLGESGALNESMSDVFGKMVEHSFRPDPENDWLVGRDILIGTEKGKAVRNLAHPHEALNNQPAHMSEFRKPTESIKTLLDLGGVHINSGIPNNAFYLATMGGKNDVSNVVVKAGVGWSKAAQVWYRVNTKYLSETSDFVAAAEASLVAAGDLDFTQNEKNIVECAWIAVGVLEGECGTIVPQPAEAGPGVNASSPGASPSTATEDGTSGNPEAPEGEPESGCSIAKPRERTTLAGTPALLALVAGALAVRRRRSGRAEALFRAVSR